MKNDVITVNALARNGTWGEFDTHPYRELMINIIHLYLSN